jgi:signal transduction histidine kinase
MVGLAHVNAGALGHWGVVVAATAERERDRERRAQWRLILAISVASGLILAFGGAALALQRKEWVLSKKLELERLTRENDERLSRLSRAATTLTLASGVAHELGTPLGVIVGRAEQLGARLHDDERAIKSVQAILEQADRIHQVVRGFLTLARGGAPSFQSVMPSEVVRGATELVQHRFQEAGVNLHADVADGLPSLFCDVRLLQHALINLLLNACDASPRGSTVDVQVKCDGASAAFHVVDEGSGIPEGIAAQVVAPFFTTKPDGKGTGLGLAIANEIALSHRGSLTIGPNGAQGTRAVLQIPFNEGGQVAHG